METTVDEFTAQPTEDTGSDTAVTDTDLFQFFEAMLRDGKGVDDMVCDEENLVATLQKMLLLAIFGLMAYGVAFGALLQAAPMEALSLGIFDAPGNPVLWMPLTLTGGFLTAIAVCLPSFYFYTQLSGLDASFRLVTAQSLRVQARTSLLLLGILPFYFAFGLTPFLGVDALAMELEFVIAVGLVLPFVVGFTGLWSVYASFRRLVERLPLTHPRRGDFVLRMVAAWAAVMACVAPVAVYRIGAYLSAVF